jgi:hypothetical protein
MKLAIASLLVLIAACRPAARGAASPTVSLPEHAPPLPPGVSVPKWDHFCTAVWYQKEIVGVLAEASENGWELVTVAQRPDVVFCFKRPRVTAPPPTGAPGAAGAAGG